MAAYFNMSSVIPEKEQIEDGLFFQVDYYLKKKKKKKNSSQAR